MFVKPNIMIDTDSYKVSHWLQYPPGTEYVSSYIEARKQFITEEMVFFGLQMFLKQYMLEPITQEQINEAAEFWAAHGEPFNKEGWEYILRVHNGKLPVVIRAIPEGTVIPVSNMLVQVQNTDPKVPWLVSYLETMLLQAIWYPTTVCTLSWETKKVIYGFLTATCENPDAEIGFKLHDFGFRGVSSRESAGIGGVAHLVNFLGTDTAIACRYAKAFYNEPMAGFSIPAAEHSTITSWGKDNEVGAFKNMLDKFGDGPLVAVVSDSFDIYNATRNLWGTQLREHVLNMKATLVVRPDSGDPTWVPVEIIEILGEKFGYTTNAKGFKVLNPRVRVIQGDGMTYKTIKELLTNLMIRGWSAENIAFGMGGGLLQHQVSRDTLGFAMKASAIRDERGWKDVFKDPITDKGKVSKKGKLITVRYDDGRYETTNMDYDALLKHDFRPPEQIDRIVYKNGKLIIDEDFATIRKRAWQ